MIRVIGDIMLDTWITGEVNRMSPEAPVPVFLEKTKNHSLGGAANLAINIHRLGSHIKLYGSIGNDENGSKIIDLLKNEKINHDLIFSSGPTTTKTRYIDNKSKHYFRWDVEIITPNSKIIETLLSQIKKNDILCLSDYNKGIIDSKLIKEFNKRCYKILVDPKQHVDLYQDVFLIKPNMKEYEIWFGNFDKEKAFINLKKFGWKWLIVTDGAKGMHVLNYKGIYKHYFEPVRKVADVTGAGDTVMSVIANGVYQKKNIFNVCKSACFAAARIVEKKKVALIHKEIIANKTVWTNGVFDILHKGHLDLLSYAKTLGTKLIVGINSDKSVKRLKGNSRPINKQNVRKLALLKLGFIDDVVIFDKDTPYDNIKLIKPDIIVKGGDYNKNKVVGRDVANVIIFPLVKGYSTTNIINNSLIKK